MKQVTGHTRKGKDGKDVFVRSHLKNQPKPPAEDTKKVKK